MAEIPPREARRMAEEAQRIQANLSTSFAQLEKIKEQIREARGNLAKTALLQLRLQAAELGISKDQDRLSKIQKCYFPTPGKIPPVGKRLFVGEKGGVYYYNHRGNKIYLKRYQKRQCTHGEYSALNREGIKGDIAPAQACPNIFSNPQVARDRQQYNRHIQRNNPLYQETPAQRANATDRRVAHRQQCGVRQQPTVSSESWYPQLRQPLL